MSQHHHRSQIDHYLTNSEEGRSRKGTWGSGGQEREREHCTPDSTDGTRSNACCECVPGAECERKTTLESMVTLYMASAQQRNSSMLVGCECG